MVFPNLFIILNNKSNLVTKGDTIIIWEVTFLKKVSYMYIDKAKGPPTYFTGGGGGCKRFFWGLKFWPKGIFLGF